MSSYFRRAALIALVAGSSVFSAMATRVPMYYVYNPQITDWFYTTNVDQRNQALSYGYSDYGIAFYVEDRSNPLGTPGYPTTQPLPFYRFYKGDPQYEHFYTTSLSEYNFVVSVGYVNENAEGYVYSTQVPDSQQLFRLTLYNDSTGDLQHFYTINSGQVSLLIQQGWSSDGVVGYAFASGGLLDSAQVPILAYHSGGWATGCNTYDSDLVAFTQDLEAMYNEGFTVTPVRMILEWAKGQRDGSTLPQKPVGITFDDGYIHDWSTWSGDAYFPTGHPNCPGTTLPSVQGILADFMAPLTHPDQTRWAPQGQYLVTSFVIASPVSRGVGMGQEENYVLRDDTWWKDALSDPRRLIDIQNHSADHDDGVVGNVSTSTSPPEVTEPAMGSWPAFNLPIGGYQDNYWKGRDNFCRIGNGTNASLTADLEIKWAAEKISSIANRAAPADIYATPFGIPNSGLASYLQTRTDHHISFAFIHGGGYIRRIPSQTPYDFNRFVKGCAWQTPSGLTDILHNNPSSIAYGICAASCP